MAWPEKWDDWGHLGDFLTGVSALCALIVASGFWKNKKLNEKELINNKFVKETANDAIDLVNKGRIAINYIRSPAVYQRETKDAKESIKEINKLNTDRLRPEVPESRDHYMAQTMRLSEARGNTFMKIQSLIPKFRIVFGTDKPFMELLEIVRKIDIALYMALYHGDTTENYEEIYYMGPDDKTDKRMQEIITEVENLCRPKLLLKDD